MKIEGSQTIAAPRDRVWAILMESGRLSQAMPHYRLMESSGENRYRGIFNVGLGPFRGDYEGTLTLSQIEPPVGFLVTFDGRGWRGTIGGNGRIRLNAQDQTTIIHYKGDVRVEGPLADLPPRLIQANVNAIIRQIIEGVRHALGPEKQVAETPLTGNVYPWETWPRATIITGALALSGLIIARAIGKKLISGNTE